jgi:hypothetical protein
MVAISRLKTRYLTWENRTAGRLHHWSVRRRWAVLVLIPALLVSCGGTIVGGPLAWITGQTIEAGKGAPNAQAAVNIYLLALSYNNDDGLLPIVGNSRGLMKQWTTYRAEMSRGNYAPSKLDFSFGATSQNGDHAQIDADVYAIWWNTTNGHLGGYQGPAHTWHFTAHEDSGWRIESVGPGSWCGGYVRSDLCS